MLIVCLDKDLSLRKISFVFEKKKNSSSSSYLHTKMRNLIYLDASQLDLKFVFFIFVLFLHLNYFNNIN